MAGGLSRKQGIEMTQTILLMSSNQVEPTMISSVASPTSSNSRKSNSFDISSSPLPAKYQRATASSENFIRNCFGISVVMENMRCTKPVDSI